MICGAGHGGRELVRCAPMPAGEGVWQRSNDASCPDPSG